MTEISINRDGLVRDLIDSCGIRPGSILIVHASLKALGPIDGGAATVVAALQEAIGPKGTILMPTFSHPTIDGIWRMADTPSRTGAVTEAFRVCAGAVRSFHPTHSVTAWGARAVELTSGHERTSSVGLDSPLHLAAKAGADILMIGCNFKACTMVHIAESIVRPPYVGKVCYPGYDRDLVGIDRVGHQHHFTWIDTATDSSGFMLAQQTMDNQGDIAHVRLAQAKCLRFTSQACLDTSIALMRNDPASLLCRHTNCPVCVPGRVLATAG